MTAISVRSPPQPDAEMLARIAEKEISRRVEARQHEGKIVLSARDDQTAPAALAAAAPVAAATGAAAVSAEMPEEPVAVEEEPAPVVADAPVLPESDETDDLVSAAVADAPMTEALLDQPEGAFATEEAADESLSNAIAAINLDRADAPLEEDGEVDIVPSLPDDEVEAFFAESETPQEDSYDMDEEAVSTELETGDTEAEMAEAEDMPAAPAPRADSIADKLARIRQVVSQHHDAEDDPDYTEDEHADSEEVAEGASLMADMMSGETEGQAEDAPDLMGDALRDITDALDADDELDAAAQIDEEDGAEDDDVSDILYRLDETDRADTSENEIEAVTSIFEDTLLADDPADALEEDAAIDENLFEDDTLDASAEGDASDEDIVQNAPRARVIKVKRTELEAAISRGDLEEYEDEPESADTSSTLSDQDEAELARELAEVEAELDGDAVEAAADDAEDLSDADAIAQELFEGDDEVDDEMLGPQDEVEPARSVLPSIDDDQNSDVSRLMAETDSQMGDEEGATRRDAFAHLRAAVAAKKADVAAGDASNGQEEDEAYRDDLASVVRPRRPASAGRTARPGAESRPAPLKLVAEQRIDVAQERPSGPVMPRRVAAVAEPSAGDETSDTFAQFATDMGATALPDLLEAAAAYMSFVEGRAQFSRPQLMTKVRQVEKEDFSREDGLRSFGKLLRDGKIEKIKGGRFQVSDQIGFKPDHRAAG